MNKLLFSSIILVTTGLKGTIRRPGKALLESARNLIIALLVGGVGISQAQNLALTGSAILGTKAAPESGSETEFPFANAGTAANVNDDDLNSRVDTYNGNGPSTASFVGIVWDQPVITPIVHLELRLALFSNGGWFGVNGIDPGPGGALTDQYLTEPQVEITTDGSSWTRVDHVSDYFTALRGRGIGGGANPNPNFATATFTLLQPAPNLYGVRLVGKEGGSVSGGFLGVFELAVRGAGADSDGDGMEDDWETANGLNVGLDDSAADPDGDGLSNLQEFGLKTNPKQADTDSDGLSDGAERNLHHTNPSQADTDGDGLRDADEITLHHTNPLTQDTDEDGFPDGMEIAQGTDPINPGNYPANLSFTGTGILGKKEALDSSPDTDVYYYNSGTAANINDGNLNSRVDTYGRFFPVSFVGIVWKDPVAKPIVFLDVTFALFSNGGWFGVNEIDPGGGGLLSSQYLVEPKVEVTTNGGETWTTVAHTSDYLSSLTGSGIGGGINPNPSKAAATFTLVQPATNITGIRLVGTDGGTAAGGFLGVFEFTARAAVADSDNDGMDDAWERAHGLNVGVNDATGDVDGDELPNLQEFTTKTDPQLADTDGDGLNDGPEVNLHHTNPVRNDTDGDRLTDGDEITLHHTNPLAKDTDGDGFSDGIEILEGSKPLSAASVPTNLASLGTGILGTKESLESGPETELAVFNSGSAANLNDANLTTRVDTYSGPPAVSFVGIRWDQPISRSIVDLELTLALFNNGGWFGVNGIDPGPGGALTDEYLLEPILEVTVDGTTWTTVAQTSDYLTVLTGLGIGGGGNPNPRPATTKFTLAQPVKNITGIRLIGSDGGSVGSGFLGVFELAVHAEATIDTQAVELLNAVIASGQIRFEFDSQTGRTHGVQFKSSLADANWQTLTTITGDGTRKQATDNLLGAQRIYRVSSQ